MKILRAIIGLILLVLLITGITYSQSQPPSPTPSKNSQQKEQQSAKANEKSGNSYSSTQKNSVINAIPLANVGQPTANKEGQQSNQNSFTKELINIISILLTTIATVVIAIFTRRLYHSNEKMWKATKESAEAARKSADALPAIERAYVFVNINGKVEKTSITSHQGQSYMFHIPINLFNAGKTPAILIKICMGIIPTKDKLTKANAEYIIDEIPFSNMRGDSDKRVIQGGGEWNVEVEFFESNLETDPSVPLHMFCCGKVIYKDFMKNCHNTWFCWEYSEFGYFSRADNDELNDYT